MSRVTSLSALLACRHLQSVHMHAVLMVLVVRFAAEVTRKPPIVGAAQPVSKRCGMPICVHLDQTNPKL